MPSGTTTDNHMDIRGMAEEYLRQSGIHLDGTPRRLLPRWIAWPLAILLSILAALILWAGAEVILTLSRRTLMAAFWFIDGVAIGLILFSFFPCTPVYVFGHELTHYIVAKMFRRKTGRLTVGRRVGALEITHPNAAIVLAPYLLPVYFIALLLLRWILRWCFSPMGPMTVVSDLLQLVSGTAIGFHVVLTIRALRHPQNDFLYLGSALSLSIIYAGNFFLLYLLLLSAGNQWRSGLALPIQLIAELFHRQF